MEKPVNIGILGCASIAKRSIIPAIKKLSGVFNLAGIASRDKNKALELAQQFETEPFSYDSLLADGALDAIYIPLPNSMHAEWIGKALDKRIHVLVEKSLATSAADAKWLNDKARDNNLALVENFQFRFHRQMNEIRNLLASGAIGELRCMRSSFGFPPFPDPYNIRYQNALGGGALLDAGAYPIKMAQLFLGNDIVVKAARLYFDKERGVDTWGGGFIEQMNGPLFSEIAFGFDHYYQCNVEFWGSTGKLTATRVFTAAPGFQPELIIETANGIQAIKVEADNHFEQMLLHFSKLVRRPAMAQEEYTQNINQARLIEEFKNRSNE